MKLHIKGENPITPRAEIKRAVTWFAQHHLDSEYTDRSWITVRHQECLYGLAYGESASFWGDPFRFEIHLSTDIRSRPLYLRTLFHELWHIKQYLTGELNVGDNRVQWKKECYLTDQILYRVTTPWERAAYRMESRLLDRYRRYLKRVGLTFYQKSNL